MKKLTALLLALAVASSLAGCAEKPDNGPQDGQAAEAEQTYTGVLEEKKDFMIVVDSEDGKNSYIFNLGDGVKCEADVGDPVTVTYTGDIADFDAQLVAGKIEKAK